jgi:RNA polymerase sigma-70 factor, ECF subfamily
MLLKVFRKKGNELSDNELLARFIDNGDHEILAELYSRYMQLVYGVCMKYLRNREDARDGVIRIYEKIASEPARHQSDNFRAWLYVVTKNYCLMEIRSAEHRNQKLAEWQEDQKIFMESDDFLHPVDRDDSETDTALKECIEKLHDLQRRSVELFYFGNKCYREIAEELLTDEKKVKSLLQNGKRNLKICLEGKNVR